MTWIDPGVGPRVRLRTWNLQDVVGMFQRRLKLLAPPRTTRPPPLAPLLLSHGRCVYGFGTKDMSCLRPEEHQNALWPQTSPYPFDKLTFTICRTFLSRPISLTLPILLAFASLYLHLFIQATAGAS